jgi:pSer/pThr/pTyr-binding forkhead associated (FHA) protein
VLRLAGRAPGGEPIELSFSSGALQKGGAMIGVGANADARIPDNRPDHRVSRLHARIAYDGRHFTIEDNKSLNKTFVGGNAIESHVPTILVNGERIRLADVELSVSIS